MKVVVFEVRGMCRSLDAGQVDFGTVYLAYAMDVHQQFWFPSVQYVIKDFLWTFDAYIVSL